MQFKDLVHDNYDGEHGSQKAGRRDAGAVAESSHPPMFKLKANRERR